MGMKPTISLDDIIAALRKHREETAGDTPIYIGIPFRNGMGLHYEGIKNISSHGNIIDIFTTVPDSDDIENAVF